MTSVSYSIIWMTMWTSAVCYEILLLLKKYWIKWIKSGFVLSEYYSYFSRSRFTELRYSVNWKVFKLSFDQESSEKIECFEPVVDASFLQTVKYFKLHFHSAAPVAELVYYCLLMAHSDKKGILERKWQQIAYDKHRRRVSKKSASLLLTYWEIILMTVRRDCTFRADVFVHCQVTFIKLFQRCPSMVNILTFYLQKKFVLRENEAKLWKLEHYCVVNMCKSIFCLSSWISLSSPCLLC